MMHGPMPISTFEQIVADNIYERFNGWGLHQLRHGRGNGAPPGTATLTIGPWEDGRWLNVPVPDIPEISIVKNGKIAKMGWRSLLTDMVASGYLRCGDSIVRWLGHEIVEKRGLQRVKLNADQ